MMAARLRILQRFLPLLVAVFFSFFACEGCRRSGTELADGGRTDAGRRDAGPGVDAGPEEDAGEPEDAGDSDAGDEVDAGDAGSDDAGLEDAGRDGGPDAGPIACCTMGDTRSCNVCGRAGTETCQSGCVWGACQTPQAPPCFPNQQRNCTSACGNTGTQTCSATCGWDACVTTVTEECTQPTSTMPCGNSCGDMGVKTCSAACTWGQCVINANSCTPPATRSCQNICGNAGTQTCSGSCAWGLCEGGSLGSCTPGEIISCEDNCGAFGRSVCDATCEWGACDTGTSCSSDTVLIPAINDGTIFCGKIGNGFQGCTDTAGDHCETSCCGDQIGITAGQADGGSFYCFSTRYLVRFPHLADWVPVGSTVSKVDLVVAAFDTPRNACDFQAAAFRAAWDDDLVNWNTAPTTTGGVQRAGPVDVGPYSIDVTADAIAMIRGTLPENGWVLRSTADTDCLTNPNRYNTDCHISLPSICQTPSLDSASWPHLVVKYRP